MKLALPLIVLLMTAANFARAETILLPDDPTFVKLGKVIYDSECAACHGPNLEGQPNWNVRNADGKLPAPPQDETGHTWHHSETQIFEMTKYGIQKFAGPDYKTDMPAFEKKLTDAEIIAVLSYIKSRWPSDVRARNTKMSGG